MIPGIILVLLMIYVAIGIVFYLHELGHFPQKIHFSLGFPLPNAWSFGVPDWATFGGLTVNVIIFLGVWYYKPEHIFLQIIGLVAWIHFILYAILGSLNFEPPIPNWVWADRTSLGAWVRKNVVLDDIPNQYAFIFIPLGIAAFWFLKDYYLPIIIQLIQMASV